MEEDPEFVSRFTEATVFGASHPLMDHLVRPFLPFISPKTALSSLIADFVLHGSLGVPSRRSIPS